MIFSSPPPQLGRQPLHELQRAHHKVHGPIPPRCLELELDLPDGIELHPPLVNV